MEKMVKPQLSFWKNKKVFVTGHTGFKGSWLCKMLDMLEAQVMGYSLKANTEPNLFQTLSFEKKMSSVIGDIRDLEKINKTLKNYSPDIVLHLAAQPLVRQSYRDPIDNFSTNVMGTAHVLEVCRDLPNLKSIICVTTDKCYENNELDRAYTEDDQLGGWDPYSASKACAELVTSSWRRSFFNNSQHVGIATARAGNVIGGGDWSDERLIPDMVRAASKNQPMIIRNPAATRPWQHVLEPLTGYLILAEKLFEDPKNYSGPWNFGPNKNEVYSVDKITQLFKKTWPIDVYIDTQNQLKMHEAKLLMLDNTKARTQLNWIPQWNIDESIQKTVQWYQAFYTYPQQILKLTETQIQTYWNT